MSENQIENLDLNLVPALYWLLTERNVTAAARRVGITQSAMSRALGRLRDIYDDPLLIKSGKTMLVTPRGEALLPLAGQAVSVLRNLVGKSDSFDPATYSGNFRIAAKDHVGARVIAAWTHHVAPKAPGLNLEIVDVTLEVVPDMISGNWI